MTDIIDEFNQIGQKNDLFLFWEKELELRARLREEPIADVAVDNPEAYNFLLRTLYYTGNRNRFMQILYANMHNINAVNCLIDSDSEILYDFLSYLPFYILTAYPKPDELMFLITIYNHSLKEYFLKIVNVLNLETCDHLLPRTGNSELRKLIRDRKTMLDQHKSKMGYGLIRGKIKSEFFPTIYGDKLNLLMEAVEYIQDSSAANFPEPYSFERTNYLLATIEIIFSTGLVEDSLAILLDIYEDYLEKNRLVNMELEEQIYNRLAKLVRKIVPSYALLHNPARPYPIAANCYRQYFSLLIPDTASLHYLDIYQTILESLQGYNKYGIYEISEKTEILKLLRPQDDFIFTKDEVAGGLEETKLQKLNRAIQQRIISLPHEAFIIMEFLRLLIKQGTKLDKQICNNILVNYLELWKWIPNKLFLNQSMVELAHKTDEVIQNHFFYLLNQTKECNLDNLWHDFNLKPDLYKGKNGLSRLQILIGNLMGVQ